MSAASRDPKALHGRVLELLARHAGCRSRAIRSWQHLERDLELTPLDLVLLAIDIEEIEKIEIPAESLASTETVAELLSLVTATGRDDKGPAD